MLHLRSEFKTLEFKYSVAQEKIQELQRELNLKHQIQNTENITLEKPSEQKAKVLDVSVQTDSNFNSNDQLCQTESYDRKDFQSQANIHLRKKTITTQTEVLAQQSDQIQANCQVSSGTTVQAIKQEIAMPNIPNSSQSQSKKRRISSMSSSTTTSTSTESVNLYSMVSVATNTEHESNKFNLPQSGVDETIDYTQVYKIYRENFLWRKDHVKAREEIEKLKNCVSFQESIHPFEFPSEIDWKRAFENTREKLWTLGSSKFDSVKKYLNGEIKNCQLDTSLSFNVGKTCRVTAPHLESVMKYFTRIIMLVPNGFEYWYIRNFRSGPNGSKWYRGTSISFDSTSYLNRCDNNTAVLNIIGVSDSMINQLHYEYLLSKHSQKVQWLKFAHFIAMDNNFHVRDFFSGEKMNSSFYIKEIKIDGMFKVEAIFRLRVVHVAEADRLKIGRNWKGKVLYLGRALTNSQRLDFN